MKRALRWLRNGLLALIGLILLGATVVYVQSERIAKRTYDRALEPVSVPSDSASIAEGMRLATIRGCMNGCHGEGIGGRVFMDEPALARIVAPDISRVIQAYSNEALARLLRFGIKRDGTSSMVMPASMLYHLTDDDLGAIIAFLRSQPITDGPETSIRVGPMGRVGVVAGMFKPAVDFDHAMERVDLSDPADMIAHGRYLALTACTECHGNDLRGWPSEGVPSLALVAAYSHDEFDTLMRTGVAKGDRELDLMALVSQTRFSHFTPEEVNALHAYLQTLAFAQDG